MAGLPAARVVMAAAATPVMADGRPDVALLQAHCRGLLAAGCDGVALFGTTGEGAGFTVAERQQVLEAVVADGVAVGRLVVAATALPIADAAALARHATSLGVAGVLLMPPCYYRGGIGEDGVVAFYDAVIERVADANLRLFLYHFPAISGVAITPEIVARLRRAHGPVVAGLKDSGGDLATTLEMIGRFPDLAVYTGTEVHIPQVQAAGGRGTICGLANVIPRLIRVLSDSDDAAARDRGAAAVQAIDDALSRGPFIPSIKAALADGLRIPAWNRVLPPMTGLTDDAARVLIGDIRRLQAELPADWRERAYRD